MIYPALNFDAEFADQVFDVEFDTAEATFDSDFGSVIKVEAGSRPHYAGPYVVTPDFVSQTLETEGKIMDDDVDVKAIQVEVVSNTSGGNTVYIGGDINYG